MRTTKILFLILTPAILCGAIASNSGRLAKRVADLEVRVEELTVALEDADEILRYVHVEEGMIRGVRGPHWIFEGVNVHLQSGSGSSWDGCAPRDPDFPNCESLTGLGNLIIGYNEHAGGGPPVPREVRTGSHNLVVGQHHSYSSYGGFVSGIRNAVTAESASVCGGVNGKASGSFSSISGGNLNVASGVAASVSGGDRREAPGDLNWAAGSLFESE